MSLNDAHFLLHAFLRLLLASGLGAAVGLERELKRKPAGLRTMMLITFGSALFTILSEGLASVRGGDPQRIAAQLIPGIGFLGAGAIIQSQTAVIGLTTAATIFAMASVGMAAGGGMHVLAIVATLLLLLFLVVLGWVEAHTEVEAATHVVCPDDAAARALRFGFTANGLAAPPQRQRLPCSQERWALHRGILCGSSGRQRGADLAGNRTDRAKLWLGCPSPKRTGAGTTF